VPQSDCDDIFGLRAFLALCNREFDFLTFGERLEAVTGDIAVVCEYVGARFLLDKAKALGFVEPFYGTGSSFRHDFFPIQTKVLMPSLEGDGAESIAATYEEQVEVLQEELRHGAINTRLNLQAGRTIKCKRE
jgi:hypothetical protein